MSLANRYSPKPKSLRGRKIGLFGGSFNPAHSGHVHVSETALMRAGLDEVWWIIARGNPLKENHGDFAARYASAVALANPRRMKVLEIEKQLRLTYTVDTLAHICTHYRQDRFVWIMGGDNLTHFHKWKRWREMADNIPILVIARPGTRPGRSVFEKTYDRARRPASYAPLLAHCPAPAWVYLNAPFNPIRSRDIRARKSTHDM